MDADVVVVGAGPAGTACAITAARQGCRVILLERAKFPREKVCGDCLNPTAFPVLERLGIGEALLAGRLAANQPDAVEFISSGGQSVRVGLPTGSHGEWVLPRSDLDARLLEQAAACGVDVRTSTTLEEVSPGWKIRTSAGSLRALHLVAADGRNSSVARQLGLLPSARPRRVAVRTVLPEPLHSEEVITLRIHRSGYGGTAIRPGGTTNVCLVSPPDRLEALKGEAANWLPIGPETSWQSIAPLERPPLPAWSREAFFVGDASRVVEPLTGEGISYALRTGELAGRALGTADSVLPEIAEQFAHDVDSLYRDTLWLNRLVGHLVRRPPLADATIHLLARLPPLARWLTSVVVRQQEKNVAAMG